MRSERPVPSALGIALLSSAARLAFAAVLLPWFLISAATKLGGTAYSVGPEVAGTWFSLGAFYQLVPQYMSTSDFDPATLSWAILLFMYAVVFAEALLPVMLVTGLAARSAAAGLIVLILIKSFIDIFGHDAPNHVLGTWFDANPYDEILDLRLLWIMLLAIPLTLGPGPVAVDRFIRRCHRRRFRARIAAGLRNGAENR